MTLSRIVEAERDERDPLPLAAVDGAGVHMAPRGLPTMGPIAALSIVTLLVALMAVFGELVRAIGENDGLRQSGRLEVERLASERDRCMSGLHLRELRGQLAAARAALAKGRTK